MLGLITARKFAIALSIVACATAMAAIVVLLVNHANTDRDEPSDIPADFNIRRGVSFGVSSAQDFSNAHYNENPSFTYCPHSDGGWTVRFTWPLEANGRLPRGAILLAVPLEATDIHTVGGEVDVKNLGLRQKSDGLKPLQPTVVKKHAYTLIRYAPKDGLRFKYSRAGVLIQETALFGIVFKLPSTRVIRRGLGEWQFRLPYQGRLGELGRDLPSTTGDAQDHVQGGGPPSRKPTVDLKICTRNSTLRLGRSVPSPVNADLVTYSWSTPIERELLVEGNIVGGWPYTIRQAAPEILIGTIWAIVGTAYGMAVQLAKQPRKRGR